MLLIKVEPSKTDVLKFTLCLKGHNKLEYRIQNSEDRIKLIAKEIAASEQRTTT